MGYYGYKLILFVCALIQLSTAANEVPGKLLLSRRVRSVSAAAAATCNGVSVYATCKDCSTVLVCLGSVSQQRSCGSSTPYCVNGACSATPSDRCVPSVAGVSCTGVGFYPDPSKCQLYHYCEGVNQQSSVYECPPNYVYNAETTLCRQRTNARDCVTVQCDQSKIFSRYGTSTRYFAFCQFQNSAVTSIQVLRCPDNSNFDGLRCVFRCPGNGNYAHPDPTKYYQCYSVGWNLVYRTLSCPQGMNFDQNRRVCVTPRTTTTVAPVTTTTVAPVTTTTVAPVTTTTVASTTTTEQPAAPQEQPAAPEEQPTAPEEQPTAPEEQPAAPEEQPAAPEEQPTAPEEQPAAPEEQPTAPEEQPEAPEEQPAAPEEQPSAPEEQPAAPEEQPTAPQEQPEAPEEQPAAPEEQPEAPEEQPTVPEEQPAAPEEQPEAPEEQPTAPEEQPGVPEEQPEVPEEQPVVPEEQPTAPEAPEEQPTAPEEQPEGGS